MIAKTVTILAAVGMALAGKPFAGVDPNGLSCDPKGQVYLLLPHFSDCSKFFMCAHGEEVQFSCSGGLIFDFELQGCNWDWDTKCVLRETPESDEGSGDDSQEWMDESGEGSGDLSSEEQGDKEKPVHKSAELDRVAEKHSTFFSPVLNCNNIGDATRQLVYKGDCQRYLRCVNGVAQTLYCSDGLFFNEKSQQCDFEANVRCNVEIEDELTGEYMVYN